MALEEHMKNIDLGQAISILANVGVIAGIVFLALQLQQNNELLGAQARATRVAFRQADTSLILENPELAGALLKHRNEEPLSEYEALLLESYINFILVNFQNVYREMRQGSIELGTIPLESWRNNFRRDQGRIIYVDMSGYWREYGHTEFAPDFVQWMEENVVNAR